MGKKKVFGTREWASYNENCCTGCIHNCRYCYARSNAIKRYKQVKPGEWDKEVIRPNALTKRFGKKDGTIMFPTQHDITPGNVDACITMLGNMLKPGNNVLIVSKPHLECIKAICDKFAEYKDQILFRFTIGASDNDILSYWEPGAPSFEERLEALKYAFDNGFSTSVSMEPVLDWPNVVANFDIMAPYVTDSIWIGVMNYIDQRVDVITKEDRERVDIMKKWQCMKRFTGVYNRLKDHPLIKWKESMKEALGLEIPDEIGLDI